MKYPFITICACLFISIFAQAFAADTELPGALIKSASDPDPSIRQAAARSLGESGSRLAVPTLSKMLLSDPDEQVRLGAMGALNMIADESALPAYTGALTDMSEKVRRSAADALSGIWDENARRALIDSLMKDSSPKVRQRVADALGSPGKYGKQGTDDWEFGDETAGALVRALQADGSYEVRASAAASLGKYKTKSSAGPLIKALDDASAPVRAAAAESLGVLESPEATSRLIALVYFEKDDTTLENALKALKYSKDPRLADAVIKSLRSGNARVRWQAIDVEEILLDQNAVSELQYIVDDKYESEGIKNKAQEALDLIGPAQRRR